MPFCSLIPPRASCHLFFLTSSKERECCSCFTSKAWSQRLLFFWSVSLWSHWSMERECCSSLEQVFTLIRLSFSLYHNRDIFTTEFTYIKSIFWFFVIRLCKILQQLSAVECFGLLMKYWHSFATVIPLNHFVDHEISQSTALKQANKGAEVSSLAVWNRHDRKNAWSFFQINSML